MLFSIVQLNRTKLHKLLFSANIFTLPWHWLRGWYFVALLLRFPPFNICLTVQHIFPCRWGGGTGTFSPSCASLQYQLVIIAGHFYSSAAIVRLCLPARSFRQGINMDPVCFAWAVPTGFSLSRIWTNNGFNWATETNI